MTDTGIVFDRIGRLLAIQAAVDGVRVISIGGYTFRSVEGVPYNTVDRELANLTAATPAERAAFVNDLIRQWCAAADAEEGN